MEPPLLSLALWNHSSGSQQEDGGREENIPVFPRVSSLALGGHTHGFELKVWGGEENIPVSAPVSSLALGRNGDTLPIMGPYNV